MEPFVGIDLGTTYSVVAYIDPKGTPQAIKDENGMTLMPSVVYFGPNGPSVGQDAKQKQEDGEVSIAAFFKREMGNPNFALEFEGVQYTPAELSSYILKHLKKIAERHIGKVVTHAVITVPAYFNNPPRTDTIKAAELAGLKVLGIIAEPTAAALAYGVRPSQKDQMVLVYDLGGGTFDVSIVKISQSEQVVVCTCGDYTLGGKDWDDRITQFFVDSFQHEFAVELSDDDYSFIAGQAESLKKKLSSLGSVQLRIQAHGHSGIYTLTREKFEEITGDLIELTRMLTQKALMDAGLTWEQIDHTLLVGGSTRMPAVLRCVEEMNGKAPLTTVNRDEAVALGAAIQAAMLMENLYPQEPLMLVSGRKRSVDVMSHSLGMIAISEDGSRYLNSILIRRNSPIPCTQTKSYNFQLNRKRDNKLEVFLTQGENNVPSDVVFLGMYSFSDFPPNCNEKIVVEVSYSYNANGVVEVQAVEQSTQRRLTLLVEPLPNDVPERFMLPPQKAPEKQPLSIYMAFDLSGSMDGEPLKEAKKAAHSFLDECDLSGTSVGIIGFSDSVRPYTIASNDKNTVSRAIDAMGCGQTGYGNSTDPFYQIYKVLEGVNGLRYALVLADGVWSNQGQAVRNAKRCHEAGIKVIGIGFGEADRKFLQDISSSDQASFFTDLSKLVETFSTIAQELSEGRNPGSKNSISTL
jgi:molecular chaperone DnaK